MELLYLLCAIITSTVTSFTLSILLLLRILLARFLPSPPSSFYPVSLYEGIVWHERRRPVHHSFNYSVRYALFDLDHAPNTPSDHLSAKEARQVAQTNGPVFLLTIPPSVGYEQNPLSLYYCYDLEETSHHLKKCIAEVTNTPWGERVTFVFNPNSDVVAKPLHVSPFMDMLGNWHIRANVPEDTLSVFISVQHPELGDYFIATLKAKRISSSLVSDHAIFFWLMPHKVALWIYWHALKLWWKKVQFIQHPRYTNCAYREEATMRDKKLKRSEALVGDCDREFPVEEFCARNLANGCCAEHRFKWRDAKWPWC